MERSPHGDTTAWIVQVWASFAIATTATGAGVLYLPVDAWTKGFMMMGLLFTIGSCFSLAKTTRDQADGRRLSTMVQSAKVEEILAKHPL